MNLASSLLYAAERNPEAEAVVEGETRLTYAELLDRVARLAGGWPLRARPGRAARRRRPLPPRHGAALLGVPVAGATFVPLSPRVSAADLAYCREDSGAALFLEVDVEPLRTATRTRARSTPPTRTRA